MPTTLRRTTRWRLGVGALAAALALPPAAASGGPATAAGSLQISTVSARADLVSGGEVLVRVDASPGLLGRVRVNLEGADVTPAFHPDPGRSSVTGLLTGLRGGTHQVVATAGPVRATLVIRNHPITGPIISGHHEEPYACTTDQFTLVGGGTLGSPLDADCSAATQVEYAYRSTSGAIKPLADIHTRPADLAKTTTTDGRTVPFLIRVETGTINRAIYQIALLHDPATAAPTFFRASAGWNHKLIYTFGGGCRGGWYFQGTDTGGVLDARMLGRGYAVASASLNVFGNNCNDLLAAETMMMVKERFIEAYGSPLFTIGWGCSGGSYQSHQIADNYPGLLGGIVVGCSFPDVTSATIFTLFDSRLLQHYFADLAPGQYTAEQQRRIAGFGVRASIPNLSDGAKRLDPVAEFPAVLPVAQRYDPVRNPGGARADVYDHTVNVYGHDPANGFARRPLDNVGVQYGLAALNDRTITVDQFLDLNARIGGLDIDAKHTAARTVADPAATRAAYQTGRILSGGGGLAATPIIDYRAYSDDAAGGDIHMIVHQFSTRARLVAANGDADNQVMLVEDGRFGGFSLSSPVLREALTAMDQWLTNLGSNPSHRLDHRTVVRAKPAGLTDACWSQDASRRKIVQRLSYENTGECGRLFPAFPTPRLVAGAPLADDIVACQRKAVDWRDYRVGFDADQRARLLAIFPHGVCDWTKPGVDQVPLSGTWWSAPIS
ncbi:DUF6351 family protein [Micromonospora sp. SL1-18]|uniref:DUF6351 family protein n=1 Tax=Micromonospora sp. SL1-18 TaxID=3399128 RepID=UPI003A4E52BE